jgi:Predicted pyrophosphatase
MVTVLPVVRIRYGLLASISVDDRGDSFAGVSGCALIMKGAPAIKDNKMALRTIDPGIEYFLFRSPLCMGAKGGHQCLNEIFKRYPGSDRHNGKNHAILQNFSKNIVMTIQEAQQNVDHWIKTVGVRYFSELTNMAILTEEVGELARHMARQYGDQSYRAGAEDNQKEHLSDEMADILWVLLCLANQTGVDLTTAMQKNFEKKNIRDAERHRQNEKLAPKKE